MDNITNASIWFREHVTLFGEPYTLDDDQVRAAIDNHKNTLVTARAGSGKTRVIVAKVAYLVAHGLANLDEIAIFMFNRTAAAEVNQRIAEVKIDGIGLAELTKSHLSFSSETRRSRPLSSRGRAASTSPRVSESKIRPLAADVLIRKQEVALASPASSLSLFRESPEATAEDEDARHPQRRAGATSCLEKDGRLGVKISIASTFHKFALDLMKLAGERPVIISSEEHDILIVKLLRQTLSELRLKLSPKERQEMLSIVSNFITRAGQYYPGRTGLKNLEAKVAEYCNKYSSQADFVKNVRFHQVSLQVYQKYLATLRSPKTDFNLLMATATELLSSTTRHEVLCQRVAPLKYILIDEYQDFSYLFFALVQAMRQLAPHAHLFCVGDDWQAINRFAGSDVNYFINFAEYFPEDVVNIPLATNYRSARRIVEQANRYMLNNYDAQATPAKAFSRKNGKIYHLNPNQTRFDVSDLQEDCLGDGQILLALSQAAHGTISPEKIPISAARLLKTVIKIVRRHARQNVMLLHRHNFTSFDGITLEIFVSALRQLSVEQKIMTSAEFDRRVRCMTMHKSKGLESNVVILLELDHEIVQNAHPHATIFELFGDTRAAEIADQQRLIYVALTRAKRRLYLLSTDKHPPA